jgi:hypothetical protein
VSRGTNVSSISVSLCTCSPTEKLHCNSQPAIHSAVQQDVLYHTQQANAPSKLCEHAADINNSQRF